MDSHGSNRTGLAQVIFHPQYEDCSHSVKPHGGAVDPFFMQLNLAQCAPDVAVVDNEESKTRNGSSAESPLNRQRRSLSQSLTLNSFQPNKRKSFRRILRQISLENSQNGEPTATPLEQKMDSIAEEEESKVLMS